MMREIKVEEKAVPTKAPKAVRVDGLGRRKGDGDP